MLKHVGPANILTGPNAPTPRYYLIVDLKIKHVNFTGRLNMYELTIYGFKGTRSEIIEQINTVFDEGENLPGTLYTGTDFIFDKEA